MTSLRVEWNEAKASSLLEAVKSQQPALEPSTIGQLSIAVAENAHLYNTMDLAAVSPFLSKTATVQVELINANDAVVKNAHTSFLLAGLQSHSEKRNGSQIILTAAKASARGTAAPIRITIDADDDEEMIDEDNLLSDASNLLAPPPAMSEVATKQDDCSGREPCADCTCGRSENKNPTQEKQPVKSSSCGKCGLGDAFRCASCPYLGKPAFKPGEEHLVLDLQDDL